MFKRMTLFFLVNILIVVTISIVLNLLGVKPYLTQYGINYESLAIFCLIWGMGGSFISLMISKFMAKRFMGVKIVDERGPYGELVRQVYTLAKKAGISKMPEVGVYEGRELNAFATGPSKNNSLVAVSTGLLSQMDSSEVEGVLGHEIAHIANGDMVTMTLLQGVVNAFVMFFARIAAFAIDQALRSDDNESRGGGLGFFAHMMVVMLFEVIFGLFGMMVVAAFSRYREFKADSGGASLAGKEKMIRALEALQRAYPQMEALKSDSRSSSISAFKISNKNSFMALFSTHPPLDKRIEALRNYMRR